MNLKRLLLFLFSYIISFLIPRSKNMLVIGSRDGKRFADNSRYFFFYLLKNYNYKIIWLTKSEKIEKYLISKKYKVFKSNSLKGLFYGFRAKYHIFDYSEYDTNEFSSIRASKINLGHGIYIKKIEKRIKNPNIINLIYNKLVNKKNYHIYPNKKYAWHILNYFPKNKYNFALSNFPRNIFLFNKKYLNSSFLTTKEKKIMNKLNKIKGVIIGYFPTWRKEGVDLFIDVKKYSELKKLNDLLKKKNSFMVVKHHSNHFIEDKIHKLSKKNFFINNNLEKLSNIINLDYDIDLNSILWKCDLLISDYSGAIIDFLITEKPIILYIPDFKKFKRNPGIFFDYDKFHFGHRAENFKKLLVILNKFFKNNKKFYSTYLGKRKKLRNVFFKNNNYFENIIDLIK